MNPYQGLKPDRAVQLELFTTGEGSNQHESLSGIETSKMLQLIHELLQTF
jgi:hypothetical protein